MGLVPHPEIPLGSLRPTDMFVLLIVGALWELLFVRGVLVTLKKKPTSIRKREVNLKQLERQVIKSRGKGPQAFVETSKLERQHLAEVKALATLAEERELNVTKWQAMCKSINYALYAIIFVVYFGIPMLELSAHRVAPVGAEVLTLDQATELATKSMQGFLFPLSYFGLALRISKLGLANPKSSIGALMVFWSSQTTISKIMDGVEALLLV